MRLDKVQVYGFDYDYTLSHYTSDLQSLIYELAQQHLVNEVIMLQIIDNGVMFYRSPITEIKLTFIFLLVLSVVSLSIQISAWHPSMTLIFQSEDFIMINRRAAF